MTWCCKGGRSRADAVDERHPYTSASGVEGYGLSGFSLWTERTAIDLTSAGGNLTPVSQGRTEQDTDSALVYPAKLSAVALTGSLYYGNATLRENARSDRTALVLAPSSQGRLDLLAGDSIYAGGYSISRSGASTGSLATPLNPSYQGYTGITRQVDNLSSDGSRADTNHFPLFAFGANSVSGEWGRRWNRRASTPLRVIWSVSTVAGCCATPGPAMCVSASCVTRGMVRCA
ncbi:hypothetical protein P4133_11810 [Pseudomonas aeruginosa]|nr:hypothetical protein [Pseudomonas aeruginosa]